MDDDNRYERSEVEQNRLTADLRAFMTANMTAGDIQALAFDIGIDPTELDGALADELAVSLIHIMTQRSELQLLDTALRDTLPAEYRLAFGGAVRDDATDGWGDEAP